MSAADTQHKARRTTQPQQLTIEKHLRLPAVSEATGLSRSTIYDMMKSGRFPQPIKLSARAVAWPESSIEKWLADRPVRGGEA